jgi:hypothetical protein
MYPQQQFHLPEGLGGGSLMFGEKHRLTVTPRRERVGLVALRRAALLIAMALPAMAATCGGGGSHTSDVPGSLRSKSIGVVSLADVSTLEFRYLLHKSYGIDTSRKSSEVTFLEASGDSLVNQLASGKLDAALLPPAAAYARIQAKREPDTRVSQAVADLIGGPVAESALVSYPDVIDKKSAAIEELDRLLTQSVTYEDANKSSIFAAVAKARSVDADVARWAGERQALPLGDLSSGRQEAMARTLQMALDVGDIDAAPDIASGLFKAGQPTTNPAPGGRITVSLALLDDVSHRAATYAIEQGIVSSTKIDVSVTYLTPRALAQAAATRQYDVIEASPLILVLGPVSGIPVAVVSAGVEDKDSTLLFLSDGPAATSTPELTPPRATPTMSPSPTPISLQGGA